MRALSWDDVESFDDLVDEASKQVIKDIESTTDKKNVCPFLSRTGEYYYFCNVKGLDTKNTEPSPNNPIYHQHKGITEMYIWCTNDYQGCIAHEHKKKKK